jgi:AAA family ATP:ADP antiporter
MPPPTSALADRTVAAERRATWTIAAMSGAGLCATFLLRPLRDQFGVDQGTERLPWLYTLTLLATVVAVVPFWWLANRMPSRRFVPVVLHACALLVGALAIGLSLVGDYAWREQPWLGELFWGGFSALNVAVPALAWIHAVEHFQPEAARRRFGWIAVGGTLGAVSGSALAGWLSKDLRVAPWVGAVVAAGLLEAAFVAFVASLRPCRELGTARHDVARGGLVEGLRVLAQDRRAQGIGVYMMLLGMLATAFYAAQTSLVGEGVASGRSQHVWLASVEFWSQSLVLVLQLFATGPLLTRLSPAVLLVSLPVVSILGLGALWMAPALLTINLVQIGRRGAQFAFEKPAREVLYTPLAIATKHKVKFLLDTFAFRLGDLLGAFLAVWLQRSGSGLGASMLAAMGVAVAWIVLGIGLGRNGRTGPN